MCMVNPHEIYKIGTTYRTQIYDICGSYLSANYKHSDSAFRGDCIWLIHVYVYICIYIYSIFIFVELEWFYYNDLLYHYGCHLPSGHWWKPRASCVYTNCEIRWSQGPHSVACGIRIRVLFEMLSLLCLFQCLGEAPASNSRDPAQPAPLAGLGCVRVTPARRPNDAGLTIVLINVDMQFPRLI